MTRVVAPYKEINMFQRYLIPKESEYVRQLMQQASRFSESENMLQSHVLSVAFATLAAALSILNVPTYLFGLPCRILKNVAYLKPLQLIEEALLDLTNAARSILFISLVPTFIAAGFWMPREVFGCFSPEDSIEEKKMKRLKELQAEIARLHKVIENFQKEKEESDCRVTKALRRYRDLLNDDVKDKLLAEKDREIARLKSSRWSFLGCAFRT